MCVCVQFVEGQGCDSYMLDTAIPRTKMCAFDLQKIEKSTEL